MLLPSKDVTPIRIRDDLQVLVANLPHDLTKEEADKINRVIMWIMTSDLTNRCREEFEKWALEALYMKPTWFDRDENGDYNNPINSEWAAWKAAWDCRSEI